MMNLPYLLSDNADGTFASIGGLNDGNGLDCIAINVFGGERITRFGISIANRDQAYTNDIYLETNFGNHLGFTKTNKIVSLTNYGSKGSDCFMLGDALSDWGLGNLIYHECLDPSRPEAVLLLTWYT